MSVHPAGCACAACLHKAGAKAALDGWLADARAGRNRPRLRLGPKPQIGYGLDRQEQENPSDSAERPVPPRAPRPAPSAPLERDVLRAVLDALHARGVLAWRNGVGLATAQNGAKVAFGQAGQADVFAIQPQTGRFAALEVKRPGPRGVVSAAQERWLEHVRAAGGLAGVVRSADEALALLGLPALDGRPHGR